jgi:hypothetical protein
MKATSHVQAMSVSLFMYSLGYELNGRGFVLQDSFVDYRKTQHTEISLSTAIRLHNKQYRFEDTPWHIWEYYRRVAEFFGVSANTVQDAYMGRLVTNAKLQYSKKQGKIITQSHIIEFNSFEVEE